MAAERIVRGRARTPPRAGRLRGVMPRSATSAAHCSRAGAWEAPDPEGTAGHRSVKSCAGKQRYALQPTDHPSQGHRSRPCAVSGGPYDTSCTRDDTVHRSPGTPPRPP